MSDFFWLNFSVSPSGDRSHTFRFQATAAMAPVARVVVYYVRADGEVVADALNFDVDGTFQNFVRLISLIFQ
jgi:CD109 antigen